MSKPNTSFPQDEFDPRPGAVQRNGVHRSVQSAWSQIWPYLVVLLITAALGLGIIMKLMQSPDSVVSDIINDATTSQEPTSGESPAEDDTAVTDDDSSDAEESPSAEPTESTPADQEDVDAEETTEPEETEQVAEVVKSASVRVLNASGQQGIAGTAADKLKADGFTTVEATNFEGEKPSASLIYYKGAENKATAEHVGSILGITNVSEVESLRADVSVVLR